MNRFSRTPLVSIVIPVYNGANYLSQAIDSALAQTWPNVEVIVVDDGSDDQGTTAAIAARYGGRIRYEWKPNGGVASAINRGIALMRGEYFNWLSHDDVLPPYKVERMLAAIADRTEPVVAFGDLDVIDDRGRVIATRRTGDGYDEKQSIWAVLEGRIGGCALVVDRRCFDRCGLFDPRLPSTQDYDLWFRMALEFPFVHVPGVMVHQRQHALQGSRSSRFADEVTLLWMSMFDRLSAHEMIAQGGSVAGFFARARRTMPDSAALRAYVNRRVLPAHKRLVALVHQGVSVAAAVEPVSELHSSGIRVAGVAAAQSPRERAVSAAVHVDADNAVQAAMVPCPRGASFGRRLDALLSRVEGELAWIHAGDEPVVADNVAAALQALMEAPAAVACLLEHPVPRRVPGGAGFFEGAVVRVDALRKAVAQSTGTATSLLHALSRLGPMETRDAAIPAAAAPEPDRGPAETPATLTPAVRASVLIQRVPPLAKAVARVLWRLCGGGERARERLLGWTGLSGRIHAEWYRERYPDVAAAGIDPVLHFLMFGCREGRDPSPEFSTAAYLKDNPDVARQAAAPVQHYALWGRRENRRARPADPAEWLPGAAADGRPAVMLVLRPHADALRFARDLAVLIAGRLRVVTVCGEGPERVELGLPERPERGREYSLESDLEALSREAARLDVRRVLVLNGLGGGQGPAALLKKLGKPFDLVHLDHDFAAGDGARHEWLMQHTERNLVCSGEQARRLEERSVPGAVMIAPPPDPHRLRGFRPWTRPVREGEALRVALFGTIDRSAAPEVLVEVLRRVAERGAAVRFFVFGEVVPRVPEELSHLVQERTYGEGHELTEQVCGLEPHLAWFPHRPPAPHSYELTDAEANGLPVAAAALGDLAERLKGRPLTWLMPPDCYAETWAELFERLASGGMEAPAPGEWAEPDSGWYRRYLFREALGEGEEAG